MNYFQNLPQMFLMPNAQGLSRSSPDSLPPGWQQLYQRCAKTKQDMFQEMCKVIENKNKTRQMCKVMEKCFYEI